MKCLAAICLVALVTSHASAIILRPGWFPYFRRTNPGARLSSSRAYVPSVKGTETASRRQTRSSVGATTMASPCKDGISLLECLLQLVDIIDDAVSDRRRKEASSKPAEVVLKQIQDKWEQ